MKKLVDFPLKLARIIPLVVPRAIKVDLWYTPPGHTALCHEETEFVEFSPEKDAESLLQHVRKQLQR